MDMVRLKLIPFVLICVAVFASMAFAVGLPDVSIVHETSTYFVTESRLFLSAQLNDVSGITEARCYFKAGNDTKYLYVPMENSSGNTYECVLPAFKAESQTMEYFFLIVGGRGLVVRSTPYGVLEADSDVEPQYLASDVPLTLLHVYSELGGVSKEETSIIDEQTRFQAVDHVNQLYGFRAGVYELSNIPDSFNGASGYFGGFIIDKNNIIRPVKGVAPNLEKSEFEYRDSVDPELQKTKKPYSSSSITSFDGEVGSSTTIDTYQYDSTVQDFTSAPPEIGGINWVGYFVEGGSNVKQNLMASIVLTGTNVTIETSLTGLGHYFVGTINSNGDMLIYDDYDGEDWTTHYGPATAKAISIYDYIRPPSPSDPSPPLNEIVLYRRISILPMLHLLL